MDEYSELDYKVSPNILSALGIYYYIYSQYISTPFLPTELVSNEYCKKDCQWSWACCALPREIFVANLQFQHVPKDSLSEMVLLFSAGCESGKIPSRHDIRMTPKIGRENLGYIENVGAFLGEIYITCILTNTYLEEQIDNEVETHNLKKIKEVFQHISDRVIGLPESKALEHLQGNCWHDAQDPPWINLLDEAFFLYKASLKRKRISTFIPRELVGVVRTKRDGFSTDY